MHPKPFNLLQSAFLWSLCGSLLISPGVASANLTNDVASIVSYLQGINSILFDASVHLPTSVTVQDVPYLFPGSPTIGEFLMGYFDSSPYPTPASGFWSRLESILSGLSPAPSTNSVDLSTIEDSLSAVDGEVTQIFGLLASELTHQHSDVEDILHYLQENVSGASRDVYQNDVTNSLQDLGTSLDALLEAFQNGFYGQGNSSAPSVPEQPPPSSDIPAPLADQLYAHSFTVDIDETQVRTAFDNTQLGSADHRFVFWSGIGLGGFSIPNAVLDMGGSEMSLAADALAKICRTVYWLMYYLAIFFLVRREYTYYASLGHTSEGVN